MGKSINNNLTTLSECRTVAFSNLSKRAKEEYNKTCRYLIDQGVLRRCDLPLITEYARLGETIDICQKAIDERGLLIDEYDRNGHPSLKPNPAIKVQRDAQKLMQDIAMKFGFNPKSRKQLNQAEAAKKTKFDAFNSEFDE